MKQGDKFVGAAMNHVGTNPTRVCAPFWHARGLMFVVALLSLFPFVAISVRLASFSDVVVLCVFHAANDVAADEARGKRADNITRSRCRFEKKI